MIPIRTFFLFCFSLVIWSAVYTSLKYFVLALKFILKFVLELPRFVLVDFHRSVAILDSFQLVLVRLCGSLGHGGQYYVMMLCVKSNCNFSCQKFRAAAGNFWLLARARPTAQAIPPPPASIRQPHPGQQRRSNKQQGPKRQQTTSGRYIVSRSRCWHPQSLHRNSMHRGLVYTFQRVGS